MGPDPVAVREMLVRTTAYIRSRFLRADAHGGWRQFLQEDGAPSVTGTACVVAALARSGVRATDPQLRSAAQFIAAHAREDGGWSKPELEDVVSLTLITCLAIGAMNAVGVGSANAAVRAGLDWLLKAQNSDGGWGYLPGDERSDVTSTAYALRVLTARENAIEAGEDAVARGVDWTVRQRDPSGGWGVRLAAAPTIAHSGHAVEALIAAGYSSADLATARDWIMAAVADGFPPWLEQYNLGDYPRVTIPARLRTSRLSWTHLTAERALIALLKLEVAPSSRPMVGLVRDVLGRWADTGYWQVATVPGTAPAWAILEVFHSLTLYAERKAASRETAALLQQIERLEAKVASLQQAVEHASEQMAAVVHRTTTLESAVRGRGILRWLSSALRRLVSSKSVRIAFVAVVTSCVLFAYLAWWSVDDSAGSRAVGAATILAPALAVVTIIARRERA